MASTVFITYSRGSLLIILAFILLKYNPFSDFRFFLKRISAAIALSFVLLISIGGILIFNPSVLKVWEDRFYYLSAREFDSGRFLRIDHAMVELERSNYTGVGFGNYSARKKIIPTVFTQMTFVGISSPHNVFILLLVELGIFGLLAYLIFICKILLSSLKKKTLLPMLIPIFLIGHNVEYVYLMYPFAWAFALLIAIALSRNMPEKSLG
jgi:O-antigen ligase